MEHCVLRHLLKLLPNILWAQFVWSVSNDLLECPRHYSVTKLILRLVKATHLLTRCSWKSIAPHPSGHCHKSHVFFLGKIYLILVPFYIYMDMLGIVEYLMDFG